MMNNSTKINQRSSSSTLWLLWSIIYIFMVFCFTWMEVELNIVILALYFIMAAPFIFKPELYLYICFLFSLITYYFCGADEGIYSIYTILMIICVLNSLLNPKPVKLRFKLMILGVFLIILACVSYTNSIYHYENGLYSLLYVIVAAICVATFIKPKVDEIGYYLPTMASVYFLLCIVSCFIGGSSNFARFSIDVDVNYNTFGMMMNLLSNIFAAKYFFLDSKRNKIYLFLWLGTLIFILLSGSRSALLGAMGAVLIIQIIFRQRHGGKIKFFLGVLIGGFLIIALAPYFLVLIGVDPTRFNYGEVISSGGTNRVTLWKALITEVSEKHMFLGIGPGHHCTSQLIYTLLHRQYTHSHNILLEAFCELGIFGLISYAYLLFTTIKRSIYQTKFNSNMFLILACFLGLMINGIGEAYFCNILPWLLIGIIFSLNRESRLEN